MEVSGLVFQISSPASGAVKVGQFSGGILRLFSSSVNSNSKNSSILLPNLRISSSSSSGLLPLSATSTNSSVTSSSAFSDNAHLDYYNYNDNEKKKNKSMEKELNCTKKTLKKKLKLIKGLSKNLSAFSDMGFGLDHTDADPGLAHQLKAKMISEATELLLGQLQQLKAEEMELKRKKKQDKANLRAASSRMMQKRMGQEDDSSSSSSSDSECEGEVVDLNRLKGKNPCFVSKGAGLEQQQQQQQQQQGLDLPSNTEIRFPGNNVGQMGLLPAAHNNSDANCCSSISFDGSMASTTGLSSNVGSCGGSNNLVEVVEASSCSPPKKIEVCMGGKCKKSGAGSLLEEFQKAIGGAAVVGCKCMGKCREGPNVRVVDGEKEKSNHPLCIGVGLEDVGLIVSNFFGAGNHQLSSSELGGLGAAAS